MSHCDLCAFDFFAVLSSWEKAGARGAGSLSTSKTSLVRKGPHPSPLKNSGLPGRWPGRVISAAERVGWQPGIRGTDGPGEEESGRA